MPNINYYPLYNCSTCGNFVHRKCATTSSGSHSQVLNCTKCIPHGKNNDNKVKQVGVSSAPKGKALMINKVTPPTNNNSNSLHTRLSYSATLKSRRSTSQSKHVRRSNSASNNNIQVTPCKNSKDICTLPSHSDLQQQIDSIKNTIHEINIKCTNSDTMMNFLKQENLRLTQLIHNFSLWY